MPEGIRVVRRVKTLTNALEELEALAKQYDVEIKPAKENALIFTDEDIPCTITYTSPQNIRTRLWATAHELGHLILIQSSDPELAERFTNASGNFWEIEAEFQAWAIADVLLEQLNPKFYEENYMRWKHTQLKTYYRS